MRKITQPRKNGISSVVKKTSGSHRKKTSVSYKRVRPEPKRYGMSKLEAYFAKNFLDKLNLRYVYEYEAVDIGRFYDFAIVAVADDSNLIYEEKNGVCALSQKRNSVRPCLIIEVDGSYYHADPRVVTESEMNAMQRKNKVIDEYKDDWCRVHQIPILRVWEYDITNNSAFVMSMLKDTLNRLEASERKKIRKKRKILSKKLENNKK